MLYVYLTIAVALIARGLYYLLQWKMRRKRRDDWRNAMVFLSISAAFIVYAIETFFRHPKEIELVANIVLAVYLSISVLRQMFGKK